ncbi:hypothetical protein A2U01_0022991 [Trifolium medium]|uniref:Uncharacterized protein n=1 Tax=Trifolium medium TaxID=97028 RepID=A0A392NQ37_9FABA|nr:hypothetical protein [Trifolium medium]
MDNVIARAPILGDPGTAISRSSLPPSLAEFLPSIKIESHVGGAKVTFTNWCEYTVGFGAEQDAPTATKGLVVLLPIVPLVKWGATVLAQFHLQHL